MIIIKDHNPIDEEYEIKLDKFQCRNCGTIYEKPLKICEVCGKDIDDLKILKEYNELWRLMKVNLGRW